MKVSAVLTPSPATHAAARRAPVAKDEAGAPRPAVDLRTGVTKEFLQAALTTQIGKAVEETLQTHGMSLQDTVGQDWSAEATSDRIVAGTTALLGVFARQNPDLSKAELVDRFEATIRGGIAKGYEEALSILEGMAAFDPSVRALGQETMRLVGSKLDTWFARVREGLQASAPDASSPDRAQ